MRDTSTLLFVFFVTFLKENFLRDDATSPMNPGSQQHSRPLTVEELERLILQQSLPEQNNSSTFPTGNNQFSPANTSQQGGWSWNGKSGGDWTLPLPIPSRNVPSSLPQPQRSSTSFLPPFPNVSNQTSSPLSSFFIAPNSNPPQRSFDSSQASYQDQSWLPQLPQVRMPAFQPQPQQELRDSPRSNISPFILPVPQQSRLLAKISDPRTGSESSPSFKYPELRNSLPSVPPLRNPDRLNTANSNALNLPGLSILPPPSQSSLTSTVRSAPLNQEETKTKQELSKTDQRARFEWQPLGFMEVRPNSTGPDEYIDVSWEIPGKYLSKETILSAKQTGNQKRNPHQPNRGEDLQDGDWIGLFRARQRIDDPSNPILTRETLGRTTYDSRTDTIKGRVRLRAPRGVGLYDFRYYSAAALSTQKTNSLNTMDTHRFPLARSAPLTVEVQGCNLYEALQFVEKNVKDKKRFAASSQQLATLIRQNT